MIEDRQNGTGAKILKKVSPLVPRNSEYSRRVQENNTSSLSQRRVGVYYLLPGLGVSLCNDLAAKGFLTGVA